LVAESMGPDGDLVAARLARGCRCFAVLVDGALGGYGWLSTGPEWIGEIQLEIAPGPAEGYVWNCFTVAEHRRKGIFRSLITGIAAAGRRDGLRRIWIGSVEMPAERALEPAGFQAVLHAHSTIKEGMCWLKVTVPETAEPSLVESARAVLGIGGRPLAVATTLRRSSPRRH
jgi:GNAT superfamily N-acetyltransferase